MLRADIELMLTTLAESIRALRETSRLVRETAAHIATVAAHTEKTDGPVSDLAALPTILTLTEIAAIYRISIGKIRRLLQAGTFSPQPFDHYPYRWTRDDVAADLKRRRQPHTPRAHGFAATRARKKKKEA